MSFERKGVPNKNIDVISDKEQEKDIVCTKCKTGLGKKKGSVLSVKDEKPSIGLDPGKIICPNCKKENLA